MGRLSYDLDELEPLTRSNRTAGCGFVQRVILFGSVNEQVCRMSPVSNEYVLYTLAQVATTLAGFSGLVVVFRVRGAQAWSRAELRILACEGRCRIPPFRCSTAGQNPSANPRRHRGR